MDMSFMDMPTFSQRFKVDYKSQTKLYNRRATEKRIEVG